MHQVAPLITTRARLAKIRREKLSHALLIVVCLLLASNEPLIAHLFDRARFFPATVAALLGSARE